MSSGCGVMSVLRENASIWLVSRAPRVAALVAVPSSRARPGGLVEMRRGEFERADDRGQQIVEIVRDAAAQPAERFHLLQMLDALFGLLAPLALRDQPAQMRGLGLGAAQHDGARP